MIEELTDTFPTTLAGAAAVREFAETCQREEVVDHVIDCYRHLATTTPEPRILSNEAEFLASERAVALLRAECDGLYASMPAGRDEGDLDLIRKLETQIEAIKKIEDEHYLAIAASPPPTLSTAILKMRLALDPVLGIEESSAPEEVQSLRQALGFFRGPDQTPFAELWEERTRILAAESTLDDGEALELLHARRDVIEEEAARRIVSDPADLLLQMLLLKNWTVERSVDFMHETFVEDLIAGVRAIAEKGGAS